MDIKKMRESVAKELKRVWGKKINRQPYLKFIRLYFDVNDMSHALTTITDVEVKKTDKKTIITIETHRPGIIIGKMGRTIDGLSKYLKVHINEDIQINLKESKLWFRDTK